MNRFLHSGLILVAMSLALANVAQAKRSCVDRSVRQGVRMGLDREEAKEQSKSTWIFRDLLEKAMAEAEESTRIAKVTLTLAKKACIEYGVLGVYQNSRYIHIAYPRAKFGETFDLEISLREPMMISEIYNMGLYSWGHLVKDVKFDFSEDYYEAPSDGDDGDEAIEEETGDEAETVLDEDSETAE